MKTNRLLLVGLLGASFAGCEIRCLARDSSPPKTQPTSGSRINVRLVDNVSTDSGEPGAWPARPDADTSMETTANAK